MSETTMGGGRGLLVAAGTIVMAATYFPRSQNAPDVQSSAMLFVILPTARIVGKQDVTGECWSQDYQGEARTGENSS